MEKFNTHGGYFAPKGCSKVNEGGTHEENPNGGVQLGVDPNGVPNMLEENEPVYNDFVYSDNIRADKKFLKENHLPEKYAGKLYSEIADDFLGEAEERPLNAISNNGLEAMLSRLAAAQESQKFEAERKDIEKELANLTPEELEQLEQMLSANEQVVEAQEVPQVQPLQVQPTDAQILPYSCGGKVHKYANGGDTGFLNSIAGSLSSARDARIGAVGAQQIRDAYEEGDDVLAQELAHDYTNASVSGIGNAVGANIFAIASPAAARKTWNILRPVIEPGSRILSKWKPVSKLGKVLKKASIGLTDAAYYGTLSGIDGVLNTMYSSPFGNEQKWDGEPRQYEFPEIDDPRYYGYKYGGAMNKYAGGGIYGNTIPLDFYSQYLASLPTDYVSQEPENTMIQFDDEPVSQAITVNSPAAGQPVVALPATTKTPIARNLSLPALTNVGNMLLAKGQVLEPPKSVNYLDENAKRRLADKIASNRALYAIDTDDNEQQAYPTWMRMVGPAVSAIEGLYDVFQEPDRYSTRSYRPILPTGRMHLTNPSYVPIDRNETTNTLLANHAGAVRAIRESGVPGSVNAIIAADNNAYRTIGDEITKAALANHQMRNDVIGRRNANEQAVAAFDLNLDSSRAGIQNDAQLRNIQNDLLLQRLNYGAEGEKYAAIGNQLNNVAAALSGIGTENFRMNAANGMFDYVKLPDGRTAYVPRTNQSKCGGTLLRKHKK